MNSLGEQGVVSPVLSRKLLLTGTLSLPKLALSVLLFSVAIQLCAGFSDLFRGDVTALDFDEQEYWRLSDQILAGRPMEVGRRTLLFPLAIAAIRAVRNDIWFVQLVIAILGATAAPLLAVLVHKISKSRMAAAIAGLGLALWPPQIFYGDSLYSETLALPLFLLSLLALPLKRSDGGAPWWRWVIAGVLLGVTAHVRPMYQLWLGVLPLILWLDLRRRLGLVAGRCLLVLAGFSLVVLPWSVYVTRSLGSPTILTANGGETLAGGFNPELIKRGERALVLPSRLTWDGPGKWITSAASGYLSAEEQKLPYSDQDRLLRARTIAWMKEHPADVAYLAARKLSYMWGIYPFSANGWRQAMLGNLPTILLSVMFLVGLTAERSVRRWGARLYLMPLFVSGIALISWGSWRFRLPADAAMIGVVAIYLAPRMSSPSRARLQARTL